jgi:hypothetical protein
MLPLEIVLTYARSAIVADLYRQRWRIEDVFNTVKRLLGLSYLWIGSLNDIQIQILEYLAILYCLS